VAAGGASGSTVADALNASLSVNPVPPKRKADGVKKKSAQQHPAALHLQQTGRRPVEAAAQQQPRASTHHGGDAAAAKVFRGVCFRCGAVGHPVSRCTNAPIVPTCGACNKYHPPDKPCWQPRRLPGPTTPVTVPSKPTWSGGGAGKGGK